jgi:two-component system sensor histidine kinase CiaH
MKGMFHSARLKLTVFYLAILLCFSLTLTFGVRALADREFDRSNQVQGGAVTRIYRYFYNLPDVPSTTSPAPDFMGVQRDQDDLVRQHLNQDLIILNLCALVVGGVLSYWYAGRTLGPIREAHEAQARFASDASHELRTPLASIQIENEVFLRQKSFTEGEARELIKSNLEEVERLGSLAANLLALTQYEQTRLLLSGVAIVGVVEAAVSHADKSLKAHNVQIEQNVRSAKIAGERESLERLIAIIIDNAIKYGPEKGTVAISGRKDNGEYMLQIHDEGPGIANEDLPYIFDRLYRGDKARTSGAGGYGLGLALAERIAKANKASITVHSAEKGGAVFTMRFDLAK